MNSIIKINQVKFSFQSYLNHKSIIRTWKKLRQKTSYDHIIISHVDNTLIAYACISGGMEKVPIRMLSVQREKRVISKYFFSSQDEIEGMTAFSNHALTLIAIATLLITLMVL